MNRIHNFNPGPAALPLEVLQTIKEEMLDFKGTGMSILEISHRSKQFEEVLNTAIERLKRLLGIKEGFHVVFVQGGATLQFAMVPLNLSLPHRTVSYIDTGTWSTKAIKEAKILGKDVVVVASSQDKEYTYIPKDFTVDSSTSYLHFTSNNTIRGTQWKEFPNPNGVPLVSDMSSDFLSRPFDVSPFGLIYAGAQKNLGPAGCAVVLIREDMLSRSPKDLPTLLRYPVYTENNSLYNTPPCFVIYTIGLVLKWLEETIGGLQNMERINEEKAKILYEVIDRSGFYRGTAQKDSRSLMNITFRLSSEELEKRFLDEAQKNGFGGLKGHRSVGGCRASVYNAVSLESVRSLASFMEEFERVNG